MFNQKNNVPKEKEEKVKESENKFDGYLPGCGWPPGTKPLPKPSWPASELIPKDGPGYSVPRCKK